MIFCKCVLYRPATVRLCVCFCAESSSCGWVGIASHCAYLVDGLPCTSSSPVFLFEAMYSAVLSRTCNGPYISSMVQVYWEQSPTALTPLPPIPTVDISAKTSSSKPRPSRPSSPFPPQCCMWSRSKLHPKYFRLAHVFI